MAEKQESWWWRSFRPTGPPTGDLELLGLAASWPRHLASSYSAALVGDGTSGQPRRSSPRATDAVFTWRRPASRATDPTL